MEADAQRPLVLRIEGERGRGVGNGEVSLLLIQVDVRAIGKEVGALGVQGDCLRARFDGNLALRSGSRVARGGPTRHGGDQAAVLVDRWVSDHPPLDHVATSEEGQGDPQARGDAPGQVLFRVSQVAAK